MAITIKPSIERALSHRRTLRKTEERLPANPFRHLAPPPMQEGRIPPLERTFFYPQNYSESIKRFSPEQQKAIQDTMQALLLSRTLTKEEIEKAINPTLLVVDNQTPESHIKALFQAAILSPSAPKLVSKMTRNLDRFHDITNAIRSIPEEAREEAIQRTVAAITDETPTELIPELLRIAEFSPSAPKLALKIAQAPDPRYLHWVHFLTNTIRSTPKEKREGAIQRTLLVITDKMSSLSIQNIFTIITDFSESPSLLNN